MKIGVDILDLRFAKTGQKTILEEYYKQFLQTQDTEVEFLYFDPYLPQFPRTSKLGIMANHLVYHCWKQILLPIKAITHRVDIVFCADYFAPLFTPGFQIVQVFYDAFFYEYPQHYNRLWLKLFKLLAVPAAKKSAYIITISEYSRQKIHTYLGIPLSQIVTIYPGPKSLPVDKQKTATVVSENPTLFSKIRQPYLLHVGVWEKRKNIPFLLRAFKQFITETSLQFQLVLAGAGNQRMYSDDTVAIETTIQELGLSEQVICTGYLSDSELANVYERATLYVFPSYNEGFGLPIMEAFRFKLPVIVANNSCLPEVGGDAVRCFDPYDETSLLNLLKEILTNPDLLSVLRNKGQERLQYFSWEKSSRQLIDVFKKAAHASD